MQPVKGGSENIKVNASKYDKSLQALVSVR